MLITMFVIVLKHLHLPESGVRMRYQGPVIE